LRGEELAAAISAKASSVKSYAMVSDLTNAVRSGRVKPWFKHLADWLHLTPVLGSTPDGKIGLSGVLLGRHSLPERFAAHVARKHSGAGSAEFAIAHGHAEADDANRLCEVLHEKLPAASCVWQTEIGSALGVHAGMQALVVSIAPE